MWGAMKGSLSARMMILSGLFLSISAAIFVLSNIYTMTITAINTKELSKVANSGETPDVLSANWNKKSQEIEMSTFKIWPYFLYSTLSFGIIGIALLFASFIYGLVLTFIPPSVAPFKSGFPWMV
jgi:hypothetical protein